MQRNGPLLIIAVLLVASLPVSAQDPVPDPTQEPLFISFEMDHPRGVVELDSAARSASVQLVVRDVSLDQNQPHRFDVSLRPLSNDTTWGVSVLPPTAFMMAGQQREFTIQFNTDGTGDAYHQVEITVTAKPDYCCGSVTQTSTLTAHMEGARALVARVEGGSARQVGPDETVVFPLQMQNLALETKAVEFRTISNPCNLQVTHASTVLPPREFVTAQITLLTPADKPFYASETCPVVVMAQYTDGSASKSIALSVQITGGYVDPGWIFTFLWIAIPLVLLFLLLAWRKRRVEEEILGKPQPPWTIPAEQIYLAELREKDARAAYVVRNFLMEDEYRSSLDWYFAYKRATKGQRSKERVVVSQERKLRKWEAKQVKAIAQPEKKADRYALKLQKKIDRSSRKVHRKELRKWRKACKKLDAKNEKMHEKLHGVWEKQVKRAQKKGLEAPPEPQRETPVYADEPMRVDTDLADHRLAAKAIRFQDRMTRKTERMQAKFDRQQERQLRRVRAKVQKIARKLDDPAFVDEHPLLKPSD